MANMFGPSENNKAKCLKHPEHPRNVAPSTHTGVPDAAAAPDVSLSGPSDTEGASAVTVVQLRGATGEVPSSTVSHLTVAPAVPDATAAPSSAFAPQPRFSVALSAAPTDDTGAPSAVALLAAPTDNTGAPSAVALLAVPTDDTGAPSAVALLAAPTDNTGAPSAVALLTVPTDDTGAPSAVDLSRLVTPLRLRPSRPPFPPSPLARMRLSRPTPFRTPRRPVEIDENIDPIAEHRRLPQQPAFQSPSALLSPSCASDPSGQPFYPQAGFEMSAFITRMVRLLIYRSFSSILMSSASG